MKRERLSCSCWGQKTVEVVGGKRTRYEWQRPIDVVIASQVKVKSPLVTIEALSFALEPVGFGLGGMYERELKQVAKRVAIARSTADESIVNRRVATFDCEIPAGCVWDI